MESNELVFLPAYIESLPPELILRIFLIAAEDDGTQSPYEAPSSVPPSQVSRRWRQIALSCPQLWSHWPRYGRAERWTDICCARSQQVPLNLRIVVNGTGSGTAGRDLALREIARAHTFKAENLNHGFHTSEAVKTFEAVLDSISRAEAPLLEALLLSTATRVCVSHPLFQEPCPRRLQFAFIRNIDFSPSNRVWPESLRVLDVRDVCTWRNVDEMVEVFRAIPNLEDLTYQYDIDDIDETARQRVDFLPSKMFAPRSASLPRLRRLQLLNERGGSRYTVPPYSTFVPAIAVFNYSHYAPATARGQSYDVVSIKDRVIIPDTARQISDSSFLPSAVRFVIPHDQWGSTLRHASSLYLSIPIFLGAKELHITRSDSPPLLRLLPTFVAVHTLTLSRNAARDFAEQPSFSTIAGRFPTLQIIRFTNVDFQTHLTSRVGPRLDEHSSRRLAVYFERGLIDTLAECYTHGLCGTWRLIEFKACRNTESAVKGIRRDARLQRFMKQVQIEVVESTYGKEEAYAT
ncbi:unnamed protein product [Peniophora sp. CBMAI 1063]|nr:unnamed protein product [Peniophora sp. CBMAI 1063]